MKKKQHFVSQFYLKAWSNNSDEVIVFIKNNLVTMNTKKIASSNYFYKIESITEETRKLLIDDISTLKSKSPDIAVIEMLINGVSLIHELGKNHDNDELKKAENILKTNMIEDYYETLEGLAAPEIKILLNNNFEKFDIYGYQNVLRYILLQLVRTKKVRKNFEISAYDELEKRNINFNAYQILASLIRAEEMAISLTEQLYKIVLISNDTEVNFITNDNPVINLYEIEDKKLKLYFPISPKKAIYIEPLEIDKSEANLLKQKILSGESYYKYFLDFESISIEEVKKLNYRLWTNREVFVYASEKKDIECIIN